MYKINLDDYLIYTRMVVCLILINLFNIFPLVRQWKYVYKTAIEFKRNVINSLQRFLNIGFQKLLRKLVSKVVIVVIFCDAGAITKTQ